MEAPFDDVLRSGAVEIHIADVYVHKLRVKLEDAMAGQAFIHTHFGFGYRFSPERSRAFHNSAASR
jgi:DNA-binding response OmpR family regulator